MRVTIERIRTLVLVAAALLLAALAMFLARARWKNRFHRSDVPARLPLNITEESNGYSYSHNLGAHSKFKIHASRAVQLKNDRVELHDVEIEIYGAEGTEADKIAGNKFEYDEKSGIASAQGPVEMLLTRPAESRSQGENAAHPHTAAGKAASQIDVKTSGVRFDRNTGVVTTAQAVNFSMTQGSGSAVGATYDSQRGNLILAQTVDLTAHRGKDKVRIRAQHAEFERDEQLSVLRAATLQFKDGEANAGQASIQFRDDGSAERMAATGGFTLATAEGGRLAAPTATMDFDEQNQPRHAHLEGGVKMDSAQAGRTVQGASPTADLDFNAQGQLRHAHLERGVTFESQETRQQTTGPSIKVKRSWRSPVADVNFRSVKVAGKTEIEPETIRGSGGVTIASESRQGKAASAPAKMSADQVTGTFGAGSALRTLVGTGHAKMEQTTATGARQTASGDRLIVEFVADRGQENREQTTGNKQKQSEGRGGAQTGAQAGGAPDVQFAEIEGHVVIVEQQAPKPGAAPQPPLRATAGKAAYEGAGEWLHLTIEPRIADGGLDLAADKLDVSRQSGDAFAHGDVKATWIGGTETNGAPNGSAARNGTALGGNGPAHAVADEAQLNESTGEATFRGHARLWQQANSIDAPEIVLNQHIETITARTTDARNPVRAVLQNAGAQRNGSATAGRHRQAASGATKPAASSVIRIRGGDLWYSDPEHRAIMRGGVEGEVVAETANAASRSDTVELQMIPAGSPDNGTGQAQVDRMIAAGHVVLTFGERRGTGARLVYSGVTGDYVLTGTDTAPPRLTDPDRGSVTGKTLIFHSRDDSVSIEGGSGETRTGTIAPKAHGK
ncbi:MAG: LptA/OstA family protein [Terracidiphilus sp.]